MAGIPTNFSAFSNVLANYNFVDIASGTGYIQLYAGKTVDLHLLSDFTYYSDSVSETVGANAGVFTKVLDIDFDTLVNRPMDLQGTGIVNVGVTGDSNQLQMYVIATLRKYDGSEHDIVSNQSTTWSCPGTAWQELAIDLVIPLTHYKVGETLRLTIELWVKNNASPTSHNAAFGCDPKNRTAGWDTSGAVPSQLSFQCPVRLNL
jgi:hypothetical protein